MCECVQESVYHQIFPITYKNILEINNFVMGPFLSVLGGFGLERY